MSDASQLNDDDLIASIEHGKAFKEPETSTVFADSSGSSHEVADDAADINDDDLIASMEHGTTYREPETSTVFSTGHEDDDNDHHHDDEEAHAGDEYDYDDEDRMDDPSQLTDADLLEGLEGRHHGSGIEASTSTVFASEHGNEADDFGENHYGEDEEEEYAFEDESDGGRRQHEEEHEFEESAAQPSHTEHVVPIPAHVRSSVHHHTLHPSPPPSPQHDDGDDSATGPKARSADGKEVHKDTATLIQEALAEARALNVDLKPEHRPFEAMLDFPSPSGIHGILKNSPNYTPLSDDEDEGFFEDEDEGEFIDPDDYDADGNFIGVKDDDHKGGHGRSKRVTFALEGMGW